MDELHATLDDIDFLTGNKKQHFRLKYYRSQDCGSKLYCKLMNVSSSISILFYFQKLLSTISFLFSFEFFFISSRNS